MRKLKGILSQYSSLLTGLLFFGISILLYKSFVAPNYKAEIDQLQGDILRLEKELNQFSTKSIERVKNNIIRNLWKEFEENKKFQFYVLENDTLIFWTSNQLNPKEVNDSSLLSKTANGYFLTKSKTFENIKVVNTVRIKTQYSYENKSLKNELLEELQIPQQLEITLNQEKGSPIYSKNQTYLFSVEPTGKKNTTSNQELFIFSFFLLGLFFILRAIASLALKIPHSAIQYFSFVIFIGALFHVFTQYPILSFFDSFELFDSLIYASSTWFPHLAQWSINIMLIATLSWFTLKFIPKLNFSLTIATFFILLMFGIAISTIFKNSIENSTIPMEIDQLFSLNKYSLILLLGVAILFYVYFLLGRTIIKRLKSNELKANKAVLLWFFSSIIILLLSIFYFEHPYFIGFWLTTVNGTLFYIEYKFNGNYSFGLGVMIVSIFAFYGALNLSEYNLRNEYQTREIYTYKLATEYDPNVELEYINAKVALQQSKYIKTVINEPEGIGVSEFKTQLERSIFKGFWERYEIDFFLFDEEREALVNYKNAKIANFQTLEEIIKKHGKPSDITEGIYFVEDYFDKLSYISKEAIIKSDSTTAFLFATYKSKRIPEQIGFPRLLINKNAKVFEELEKYSMAKYRLGKLVMRYNSYNYPLDEYAFINQFNKEEGFVEDKTMSHYIYRTDELSSIVLSKPKLTKLSVLTSFSYLFTFFGILLLIPTIADNRNNFLAFKQFNLRFKIQLVLISLVVVSLLVFGLVSGGFVKSQYTDYTNDNIQERIYSVNTEVQQKLGDKDELDKLVLGNYMEYILQKFSRVFVTDINLYDLKGRLLSSSQPKIYKMGLITEQIDPTAYKELRLNKRSEFIHNENIGKLNYLSAYIPFLNNEGKLLAYLNLQYFAKQNKYESQISSFLVALINLAVLLIVSSIVIAIFVTNWITTPLKLIQRSFSSVELGKTTQPINYAGDDEIGAMVREYNTKLSELEIKALQLAKSERESAWREMAKQVAHEIKNPLTPMKLRLQHFERTFNPKDDSAKEKLTKTTASLIEQIDALTNIANEFSNFAKMPKPNKEKLDLIPLLESCILLFINTPNINLQLHTELTTALTFADKNLVLRVFNNLIKNSIQAIPENTAGEIKVTISKKNQFILISIADNGAGIPVDKQNKIFVPNFTTKSTGTGLGLAMVKQIVENHNGTIWFETKENIGTVFKVSLPKQEE